MRGGTASGVSDGYRPIGDYAVITDCHTAALVSPGGSIDWFCPPRFDAGSCFGRLLDADRGGSFELRPEAGGDGEMAYVDDTLVLCTRFTTDDGTATVTDCLVGPPAKDRGDERRRILRVVDGVEGSVRFRLRVDPRFDYGEVTPWLRCHEHGVYSATGGDDGLLVWSDAPLRAEDDEIASEFEVPAGERARVLLWYVRPEIVDEGPWDPPAAEELDRALEETLDWWRACAAPVRELVGGEDAVVRSALVLKSFSFPPTGAIVAAATTSLPESLEGGRNWDYRFTWIRDSALASRSLALVGMYDEADGFRRFVERAAAGRAGTLRILYGLGGERRLAETGVDAMEGWRGIGPVRVGNAAAAQMQLDSFGHLLVQSWRWHARGHSPDEDYWRFLRSLVERTIECWREPDAGLWEWRGSPRHFVHSKVQCWAAIDRGIALAEDCGLEAPLERWHEAREEIRAVIERDGYDEQRGAFVQAFDTHLMDAALLRLPTVGFIDWDDERMVRTTDAVRHDLEVDGFLLRYDQDDNLEGDEGAFLACSFWLAEAYARQGRVDEAREVFETTMTAASPLGLFSEEYDPRRAQLLGNYPQGLTHLSHIEAALALAEATDTEQRATSAVRE